MAEKMGRRLRPERREESGGWKKGLSPGLFRPNTDGARDRSPGSLGALQELESFLRNFLKTQHRTYILLLALKSASTFFWRIVDAFLARICGLGEVDLLYHRMGLSQYPTFLARMFIRDGRN